MRPSRPTPPTSLLAATRRSALRTLPLGAAAVLGLVRPSSAAPATPVDDDFPSQDADKVYQVVLHAHTDLAQVERLVEAQPDLAKSAIDWGFGDWESALGAASHMGRADIAKVLIDAGARPDLFTHAMLGHLGVVRAAVEAQPGIQSIAGPHGFSLLFHARAGGEAALGVLEYLEGLGDADPQTSTVAMAHDAEAYTGRYAYGDGQFFEIQERRGVLRFQRGEDFPRTLSHLGGNRFRPGGSRGVEIRFEMAQGRATVVEVRDPELIVRGTRL